MLTPDQAYLAELLAQRDRCERGELGPLNKMIFEQTAVVYDELVATTEENVA